MQDILFNTSESAMMRLSYEELQPTESYICCTFLTPYPPGFPIVFPGQIVTGDDLKLVLKISGEVHGVGEDRRLLRKELTNPTSTRPAHGRQLPC